MSKLPLISLFLAVTVLTYPAGASDTDSHFEVEAGVINTHNFELHGYQQPSATADFTQSAPDLRLEYWRTQPQSWNYGLVAQPLSVNYSGSLSAPLTYKGKTYEAGEEARVKFQFPTVRGTANYPVFIGHDPDSYVRIGGSLIVRYANIDFQTPSGSFKSVNWIGLPLFNVETSTPLSEHYRVFTRSDFLPSVDGNTLLDGLFDVSVGLRRQINKDSSLDLGVRLFFGGYDPKKVDDYASRIFYDAIVLRYSFR